MDSDSEISKGSSKHGILSVETGSIGAHLASTGQGEKASSGIAQGMPTWQLEELKKS